YCYFLPFFFFYFIFRPENGLSCFFFFQAEDGIRDSSVTGVQTCALPISHAERAGAAAGAGGAWRARRARGARGAGRTGGARRAVAAAPTCERCREDRR